MDYKQMIFEALNDIENESFLKFIYDIIKSFIKEWGY